MKKLALVLAMVCFVLSLGFAQEFKPEVKLEGSATLTAGYNLDTQIFGLKNAFSADLKLTLIPENTGVKGEGDVYGWIQLKEFKLEQADIQVYNDDDVLEKGKGLVITNPNVFAKIVAGPVFFQIMDESNATKDISAGRFGLPDITDGNLLLGETKLPAAAPKASYFYTGYDSEMVDFTLKASTLNNYCTDPDTAVVTWYFAPSAAVTVAGATVKAGAIVSTADTYVKLGDNPATPDVVETSYTVDFFTGFGGSLSYKMALNDKINLEPTVGFDMQLAAEGDDATWAAGVGVFAKWGGNDEYDAYLKLEQDCDSTYKTGDDVKYQGGAGVSVQYTSEETINLIAQVNEQRGDDGLVPGLGAALALEVTDVTGDDPTTAVGAFMNYKMGDFTPYVRAVYRGEEDMTFGAGVELANVIANTKVFADYNSWNVLAATNNMGLVTAGVKISF